MGRYDEALATAEQASDDTPELFVASWALSAAPGVEWVIAVALSELVASQVTPIDAINRKKTEVEA